MNVRVAFLCFSFAFAVSVLGAVATTKNAVDARHAEGRQTIARPAG
jgi:hypothetical protein